MSVELKINKTSDVLTMSGCSKVTEGICGIMYRAG